MNESTVTPVKQTTVIGGSASLPFNVDEIREHANPQDMRSTYILPEGFREYEIAAREHFNDLVLAQLLDCVEITRKDGTWYWEKASRTTRAGDLTKGYTFGRGEGFATRAPYNIFADNALVETLLTAMLKQGLVSGAELQLTYLSQDKTDILYKCTLKDVRGERTFYLQGYGTTAILAVTAAIYGKLCSGKAIPSEIVDATRKELAKLAASAHSVMPIREFATQRGIVSFLHLRQYLSTFPEHWRMMVIDGELHIADMHEQPKRATPKPQETTIEVQATGIA